MKEKLITLAIILAIILLVGGWWLFSQALDVLKEIVVGFFPIFSEVGKMAVEEYIKSPYFITGAIMVVASAFGIYFSAKGGKVLWIIVSIVCELASLASICANIIQ